MSTDNISIPSETASHVLWTFACVGGHRPGSFTEALLGAFAAADNDNEAKLALAYPAEAAAVRLAKYDEDGIAKLQRIAAGDDAVRCTRCADADGPFTAVGLCEGCAKSLPLGGVM